jgi:DamX protein
MTDKQDELNYISALNLTRDPFAPEPDLTFFYEYESLENCFALLNRLVQGTEIIILVIGEAASGKTSVLKRYLTASIAGWKSGRIRIHPEAGDEPKQPVLFDEADSYPAYFLRDANDSIIIIDDAHELDLQQLKFLLQNTQSSGSSHNVRRFVLFGEPRLNKTVSALVETLSNENDTAISKIFLPPMTQEQTTSYLNYRLAVAGYVGKSLFRSSSVKKIQRSSGGLPGKINTMADQQLNEAFSKEKQRQGGFGGRIHQHTGKLGWAAAGLAIFAICLLLVYYYRGGPASRPERPGLAQMVIRGKIEKVPNLEKTPPLIAEVISSDKKIPSPISLEKETRPIPAILPPLEKSIEMAKKPAPIPKLVTESEVVAEQIKPDEKKVNREDWLLSQESSGYTIQILGVRNEKRLLNFIENELPSKVNEIAYYQTSYKGKDCYPLLYGVYASQKEAATAMKQLPANIQKTLPWIRKMSSVQRVIRKRSKP